MTAPAMTTRHIIQIVPRRGSAPDGVRDYAAGIAHGLRHRHAIETTFVSGSPLADEPAVDDGWPTATVATRSAASLRVALDAAGAAPSILLHVAGYGYAGRGAPVWLLDGIRRWRRETPGGRLVCVFHELYATGKPWNSSFWLGPLQKHVARELWRLADAGVTTTERYHRELKAWRPAAAARLALMPVPSGVGEPAVQPPWSQRQRSAAVFGGAGTVQALYNSPHSELAAMLTRLGIAEIVDIGRRTAAVPQSVGGIPVRVLGQLPAEEVSRALLDCRVGLMAYDASRLGKSSIFGAYCGHGLVPVCLGSDGALDAGLVDGRQLLLRAASAVGPDQLQAMHIDVVAWYRGHTAGVLADQIADMLQPGCSVSAARGHQDRLMPLGIEEARQ